MASVVARRLFGLGCRLFSLWHLVLPALAVLGVSAGAVSAQSFPFGRELVLDVNPMPGSKRVPVLDLDDRGTADIDLWCSSVKATLVIAANTVTIITGEKAARTCSPALARADDDLIDALNQVTNWRMENYALVFTGSKTLRFRLQTN
jgi:hypothetical protein